MSSSAAFPSSVTPGRVGGVPGTVVTLGVVTGVIAVLGLLSGVCLIALGLLIADIPFDEVNTPYGLVGDGLGSLGVFSGIAVMIATAVLVVLVVAFISTRHVAAAVVLTVGLGLGIAAQLPLLVGAVAQPAVALVPSAQFALLVWSVVLVWHPRTRAWTAAKPSSRWAVADAVPPRR